MLADQGINKIYFTYAYVREFKTINISLFCILAS